MLNKAHWSFIRQTSWILSLALGISVCPYSLVCSSKTLLLWGDVGFRGFCCLTPNCNLSWPLWDNLSLNYLYEKKLFQWSSLQHEQAVWQRAASCGWEHRMGFFGSFVIKATVSCSYTVVFVPWEKHLEWLLSWLAAPEVFHMGQYCLHWTSWVSVCTSLLEEMLRTPWLQTPGHSRAVLGKVYQGITGWHTSTGCSLFIF